MDSFSAFCTVMWPLVIVIVLGIGYKIGNNRVGESQEATILIAAGGRRPVESVDGLLPAFP